MIVASNGKPWAAAAEVGSVAGGARVVAASASAAFAGAAAAAADADDCGSGGTLRISSSIGGRYLLIEPVKIALTKRQFGSSVASKLGLFFFFFFVVVVLLSFSSDAAAASSSSTRSASSSCFAATSRQNRC